MNSNDYVANYALLLFYEVMFNHVACVLYVPIYDRKTLWVTLED